MINLKELSERIDYLKNEIPKSQTNRERTLLDYGLYNIKQTLQAVLGQIKENRIKVNNYITMTTEGNYRIQTEQFFDNLFNNQEAEIQALLNDILSRPKGRSI